MRVRAAAEYRRVLALDENFWIAAYGLSVTCALSGMLPEALHYAEKAHALAPWVPNHIGTLAGVLKLQGETRRAEEILGKLGDGGSYGAPIGFQIFHLLCSETDKAAHWAEKAIEQRHPQMPSTLRLFESVWKSSPRWPALARKVNLTDMVA
jgi:hypothetical protein